jgi:hypothetical protein
MLDWRNKKQGVIDALFSLSRTSRTANQNKPPSLMEENNGEHVALGIPTGIDVGPALGLLSRLSTENAVSYPTTRS